MASITWHGQPFEVRESLPLMPLMRFAKVAQSGGDSNTMAGMVAMYDLLRSCFPVREWQRFEALADEGADGDDLFGVVTQVIEVMAERPTSRPSDSSDGSATTSESSPAASSSVAAALAQTQGRPDLQLAVLQAQAG